MIEDGGEKGKIGVEINAEIVRVPPQMKDEAVARCFVHCRADAIETQLLERAVRPNPDLPALAGSAATVSATETATRSLSASRRFM